VIFLVAARPFLFKELIKGTSSYFGADSATKKKLSPFLRETEIKQLQGWRNTIESLIDKFQDILQHKTAPAKEGTASGSSSSMPAAAATAGLVATAGALLAVAGLATAELVTTTGALSAATAGLATVEFVVTTGALLATVATAGALLATAGALSAAIAGLVVGGSGQCSCLLWIRYRIHIHPFCHHIGNFFAIIVQCTCYGVLALSRVWLCQNV
jgi:hypothetical protein